MLKKIFKYLLLFIPVIILAVYLLTIYIPEVSLSDNKGDFQITFDSDIKSGGSTKVSGRKLDNAVYEFTYELGSSRYPYAVIKILNKENDYIKLSEYSHIRIKIKSSSSDKLILHAYAFVENLTILDNFSTYLPLDLEIPVTSEMEEYYLPVKDFKVPSWWYIDNGINDPAEVSLSMDSIYYIELSNSETEEGFRDIVTIEEITLYKSLWRVSIKLLISLALYYTLLLILLILYRRRKARIQKVKASLEEKAALYEITKRELEVIELVFEGLKYKEVSEKLFISMSTVKKHITSVYRKTGTSNKVELISLLT